MTGGSRHGDRDGFTPPLPHDPPPPPGYVDPLEAAQALADLTTLVREEPDAAHDGQAAAP